MPRLYSLQYEISYDHLELNTVCFYVFLAPQCTALRCPWVSALVLPVVRVPSGALGLPFVFVYCTQVQVPARCAASEQCDCCGGVGACS